MILDGAIRPLTREDVVRMAREQAESREPMRHEFDAGSTQAATFERAYIERQRELEEFEG